MTWIHSSHCASEVRSLHNKHHVCHTGRTRTLLISAWSPTHLPHQRYFCIPKQWPSGCFCDKLFFKVTLLSADVHRIVFVAVFKCLSMTKWHNWTLYVCCLCFFFFFFQTRHFENGMWLDVMLITIKCEDIKYNYRKRLCLPAEWRCRRQLMKWTIIYRVNYQWQLVEWAMIICRVMISKTVDGMDCLLTGWIIKDSWLNW